MHKVLNFLNQSKFFVLSIIIFCLGFVPLILINQKKLEASKVQESFTKLERELDQYASKQFQNIVQGKSINPDIRFNLHLYEGDSLIYWSTNKLPVSKYTEPQFPNKGRIQLQNGWYYGVLKENERFKLCATFAIKQIYSIQNEMLQNIVNEELSEKEFEVGLQEDVNNIYNSEKEFVFSVKKPLDHDIIVFPNWFFILCFLALLLFIIGVNNKINITGSLVINSIVLIVVYNVIMSLNPEIYDFSEFTLINTKSYYFDGFTLFDLLFFACFMALFVHKAIQWIRLKSLEFAFWIYLIFGLGFWLLTLETIHFCVEFSALTMLIKEFFSLKEETLLILLILGLLFYTVNYIFESLSNEVFLNKQKNRRFNLIVLIVSFLLLAILRLILWEESFIIGFVPLLLLFCHLFFINRKEFSGVLSFQLILIALFSLTAVFEITEHFDKKDKEIRRQLAENLFIKRDYSLEKDFNSKKPKILNSPIIKATATNEKNYISKSTFNDILEKKIFNGFWEQYDMTINLVDTSGVSFFSGRSSEYKQAKMIVNNHGVPVNKDSSLYFISNEYNGYSYILIYRIEINQKTVFLTNLLKSKKIPENIGFPRLLISKNVQSIGGIENYSVAKYASGRLAKSFGEFNFKTNYESAESQMHEKIYEDEGYSHFVSDKEKNNAVIISRKQLSWLSFSTVFSYLFIVFGLILLSSYVLGLQLVEPQSSMSLSFKIQSALVLLVVLSLILFGTGSGIFITNQYEDFTSRNINAKLNSVEEELKSKISENTTLSKEQNGNYFESILMKFSNVFDTDLNMYNTEGHLVASSRPQIFKMGLLSEQINPEAYDKLRFENKSYFKHDETISELSYISAYQPIYNAKGNILGYINLQYFGQQKEYENQIQQFVVAIINVFILLIGFSIIIALVVSNWLTSPLRNIQEKLMSLELGKTNEKIVYHAKDELGMLVHVYNLKIDELNLAIQKLSATERESAWREMAKQVAHEIKNPLTPMKLSIQQLLRTVDSNGSTDLKDLKSKLNSLIQQIDGLSNIANEFSNFAKMPPPVKSENDLISIIKNCIDVFSQKDGILITWESELATMQFDFDKNQWVQIINNILKNSFQAIEDKEHGLIEVSLKKENQEFQLVFIDNGTGMDEQTKEMLFTPHFTTKSSGSGIGLALVKQILENHQATIEIESELGKGTKVIIHGQCV